MAAEGKATAVLWPSENLENILRIGRVCSSFVGANVSLPTYRVGRITYTTIGLISCYFLFTAMTIAKKFNENWKYALEASCMSASVIQGVTKLISGIVRKKDISEMCILLKCLYKKYESCGDEYREELQKSCNLLSKTIKSVGIVYITGITGIITPPIYLHMMTGEKHLVMHFHFPGLDVTTPYGYYATMAVQLSCMWVGGFGLFAGDFFLIVLLMQSDFFIRTFRLKVKALNKLLEDPGNRDKPCSHERLVELIQWQQLYMHFTTISNKISWYIVSVQVTTTGLSIVLTIFIIITGHWYGGYSYMTVAVCNLYIYCIIGTKTDVCNFEFTKEIYNISWYNLRAYHRKMVRLMLMQSQSPIVIEIGGFMPLTVATALQITKTIYTISMMMIRFLSND